MSFWGVECQDGGGDKSLKFRVLHNSGLGCSRSGFRFQVSWSRLEVMFTVKAKTRTLFAV